MKKEAEKLSAQVAATVMKLVRTYEGEKHFPNQPDMKANTAGQSKFQRVTLAIAL